MSITIDNILEGAPAYGVLDARDGVVLFQRPGFEQEFSNLTAELIETVGGGFEVIPLKNGNAQCDRIFIAPLREERTFDPPR